LGLLPQELYDIAILRQNNPDASLNTLCQLYDGTITRSGINHRLQRIITFANDKREELKK
jgi:DNA-binding transcriptional regulator WhiA